MNKLIYSIAFLFILMSISACGQNRHQGSHKQYSKKQLDSLRITDSLRADMQARMYRAQHPETDSLRVLDMTTNFDPTNLNNYVIPRVRIQNETKVMTWKYKEIIFHIYVAGKEVQQIPAQFEGHMGPRLDGAVPPNMTVVFVANNPIDDGKGIPTSGDSPGARWYNSGATLKVQIVYDYPKPIVKELSLVGVEDRSMKSAGTFHFTNEKNDTAYYCESQDSCLVDGKSVPMYPGQWQAQVKPEFINKKFRVTFLMDNSPADGTKTIYMNVKQIILVK